MKGAEISGEELEGVLKGLLSKNVVDALILPQRIGNSVAYTLVKDENRIKSPALFAPAFTVNVANNLKKWLIKDKKLGVVAKPCEIRAAIELIKLEQINRDSVLLICTDCYGCFKSEDYTDHIDEIGEKLDEGKLKELEGKGISIREACLLCENRLAEMGDVIISPNHEKIGITGITEKGVEALSSIEELSLADKTVDRSKEKEAILAEVKKKKEEIPPIGSIEALEELLSNCIVCKNCRDMCPVCYCKECFFEQPLGNPAGGDLLNLASLRGGIKIPTYGLFYHLTRIYHVCVTCVGCGACEDACPKGIPLTRIYPLIAEKVQEVFEYLPGRDIEEPLPLTTYKEDELEPR
ncbi:MAG: 4Fe-4S dicluster domain-containing protein [Candidatus Syntropharchaeia archaeon]